MRAAARRAAAGAVATRPRDATATAHRGAPARSRRAGPRPRRGDVDRRPRRGAESLAAAGRGQPPYAPPGRANRSRRSRLHDDGRGRTVARLTDGRVPATGQAFPGARRPPGSPSSSSSVSPRPRARRAGRHGIPDRRVATRGRRRCVRRRRARRRPGSRLQVRRHEPSERRQEGDRGRFGEAQAGPVHRGQSPDALDHGRHPLRDRAGAADDRADRRAFGQRARCRDRGRPARRGTRSRVVPARGGRGRSASRARR